jgi:hypothetical protein
VDELFGVEPEAFTAARKRVVAELKQAGETEAARRVAALKRPTVTVWAANQLARRHRAELASLFEVAAELRRAQQAALSGRGGETWLELGRRERQGVAELVARAEAIARAAGKTPTPAFSRRVGNTIQAAVTAGGEAGEALRRGRLTDDLTPEATFGAVLTTTEPRPRGRERAVKHERARPVRAGAARAAERARVARERERKLRQAAKRARTEAKARRRAAESAKKEAARADTAAGEAARHAADARAVAVEAQRRAAESERDAAAAERAAADAESRARD